MSEATNQGVFLSTTWSSQLSVDHSQGPVMGELYPLLFTKEGHHGEPCQGLHFVQCPQQLLTDFAVF